MWIICQETINLGGGKFIAPSKKVQVPDSLGLQLIGKNVAVEIEVTPLEGYVASQRLADADDEGGTEVDENGKEVVDGAGNTADDLVGAGVANTEVIIPVVPVVPVVKV